MFHIHNNIICVGYLFPGGYRLFGTKVDSYVKGLFFMECRNFKKTNYGMLAAMISLSTKVGLYPANLVLVHGVEFNPSKQCYIVHYREWKHKKYLSHFLKEDSLN